MLPLSDGQAPVLFVRQAWHDASVVKRNQKNKKKRITSTLMRHKKNYSWRIVEQFPFLTRHMAQKLQSLQDNKADREKQTLEG